ncbi:Indoleamine 2,3-dioxygenase [Hygrophoropsis aurantiaca]|uniref:Indoleamine 2,3-dioxygenase n=1 Tax=Hygrophoropsis aurantiaca TaxID=72124 RepID=A0ACB8APW6_9AGAM|nr:Indoleamine 2,3-dioxygenase [Hygrophoropsis aurantiaca]
MSDENPGILPLPSEHFLNLPRPDIIIGTADGVPDTSTLAAHDFDVDTRTGFMPPQPPISRLPPAWEPWELVLEAAITKKLQLGGKPNLTAAEAARSALWRSSVREMPILPIEDLTNSELLLRRAHHVLVFTMHFYIHTLSLGADIRIPASITVPLLEVSAELQIPPVCTYSDDILYNWDLKTPSSDDIPALDNLRSQTLFTGTTDEEEFYLASSRIELRGVEALELMQATMDEMFVGDDIAIRRISGYLHKLASVINDLKSILLNVRKGCDPEFFYHSIRPWFRGQDSDPTHRTWFFEGLDEHPELGPPTDLSGPSAGQSAIIHSLDIFLGLDNCNFTDDGSLTTDQRALLHKMQRYMPRHHRNFLRHLSTNSRSVRTLMRSNPSSSSRSGELDADLLEGYNAAVRAVKEFRDAHLRIVAIYIIGPASRERTKRAKEEESGRSVPPLKGTGGTNLMQFLKGVRDKTTDALIPESPQSPS